MADKNFAESRPDPFRTINQPTNNTNFGNVTSPSTHIDTTPIEHYVEGLAEGGLEDLANNVAPASEIPMQDVILHLRKLRQEKESIQPFGGREFIETPDQTMDRLNAEVLQLHSKLLEAVKGKEQTIEYALQGSDVDEEERQRLQNLTVLDNRDTAILDGLDFASALQSIQEKLKAVQSGQAYQNIVNLTKEGGVDQILMTGSKALFQSLEECLTAPKKVDGSKTSDSVEIYCPVGTSGNSANFLDVYTSLDERVSELERVVGIDSFLSGNFLFSDIISALSQITERILCVDPRRVDAIAERALEVITILDRAIQARANLSSTVPVDRPASEKVGMTSRIDEALELRGRGLKDEKTTAVATSEEKIEILYEMFERWRNSSFLLPRVVKKLEYLSVLANDASTLDSRVVEMEGEIERINEVVGATEASIGNVEAKVNEQIALMTKLLKAMESS